MEAASPRQRLKVVVMLGVTQTLAWASSYYIPAILAGPIARDLGISMPHVFAAFSSSLLLSAILGPAAGRQIDRFGGRGLLAVSNLIFAAGLGLLAITHNVQMLWFSWAILGVGMGIGLYDAAFATLGKLYGIAARGPITGITLFAGFASTIGWPLSSWGNAELGWRHTCLLWAAAHLVIGLPLNVLLPRTKTADVSAGGFASTPESGNVRMDRNMVLLAFAFAAAWFVTAAMASHLPRILETAGASSVQAVALAALVGPAQVAARIFEASILRNFHPLVTARLAALTHPLGAAVIIATGGSGWASAFTLLHGAGNGILTIARGTVPLAIYGPQNYGYRLGILGAPSRIAQASAPLIFGFLLDGLGAKVLTVSAIISLMAFAALMLIVSKQSPP